MSVFETSDTVNSTLVQYEDKQGLLTPGQIALITILTTFVFYMTIMFIVCVGEYCQYASGKKKKPEVRRRHHSAAHTPGIYSNTPMSRSHLNAEITASQSEFITSTSPNQSEDSRMSDRPCRPSVQTVIDARNSMNGNDLELQLVPDDVVEVHFEESLDSPQNVDCTDTCENTYMKSDQDIVMHPLISRQSDDVLDIDGEILCDSSDSKDMYRLEADV